MNFTTLKYFTIFGNGENLTADLLKNLWRKVCVKTHPDKGGTNEQYIESQNEYESLLQFVNAGFTAKDDSPEAYNDFMTFLSNITPAVHEAVMAVMAIEGIRAVSVVGFWVEVAITYNQKVEREAIKAINIDGKRFGWNKYKKIWVWKGKQAVARRRFSDEERKEIWGHEEYQKDLAVGA